MDRKSFYDQVRPKLGGLTGPNVMGFELFITEALRRAMPLAQFAYCLATAWWETAHTMQPVLEAYWVSPHDRAKHDAYLRTHRPSSRYFPFYGRSYPQWTWERNYKLATDMWNSRYRAGEPSVDFVANPDAIMDPKYGIPLFFDGMEEGWFTGKKEADYIDSVDESDAEDFREFTAARRVVNGTDKAREISELALTFEHALRAAAYWPA